jgi:hypothetical protein
VQDTVAVEKRRLCQVNEECGSAVFAKSLPEKNPKKSGSPLWKFEKSLYLCSPIPTGNEKQKEISSLKIFEQLKFILISNDRMSKIPLRYSQDLYNSLQWRV